MPVTAKSLLRSRERCGAKDLRQGGAGDGRERRAAGRRARWHRGRGERQAAGAVHIPRGSLEFKADPTAASADKNFAFDRP